MDKELQPQGPAVEGGTISKPPMPSAESLQRTASPARSTFVFDGDCTFCRMCVTRWQHAVGDHVDFQPIQEAAHNFPQIAPERFRQAAQLIEPDGRRFEGAAAVFRAMRARPLGREMWWAYRFVPLFGWICNVVYRFVAGHRPMMTSITRFL